MNTQGGVKSNAKYYNQCDQSKLPNDEREKEIWISKIAYCINSKLYNILNKGIYILTAHSASFISVYPNEFNTS